MIEVENVTVTYQNGTTAVNHVSIDIPRGTFFGFLGPNGAGKTTLVKTIATLLQPTTGSIVVNGYDTVQDRQRVRESIGYMPQETSVDEELTGRENLEFACDAYNVPHDRREQKITEILKLVQLDDVADQRAGRYSGGMQKRLDAATSLVHNPDLVFLDEPTTGLDPNARNQLWEYFQQINNEGTTMFLTTQYLEEADHLCEDIAVMQQGNVEIRDSPAGLKQRIGGDIITIKTSDNDKATDLLNQAEHGTINQNGDQITITTEQASKKAPAILTTLQDHGVTTETFTIREPTLDDVFISLTNK